MTTELLGSYTLQSRSLGRGWSGPNRAYRVFSPAGEPLFEGAPPDRHLRKPVSFIDAAGSSAFVIRGRGSLSPHTWMIDDGAGEHIASFRTSAARRARTKIELASGRQLVFGPSTALAADYVKAAVLAHSDRFLLLCDGEVVADTAPHEETVRPQGLLGPVIAGLPGNILHAVRTRGEFTNAGALTVLQECPGLCHELIGALLVLHDAVIEFIRSP